MTTFEPRKAASLLIGRRRDYRTNIRSDKEGAEGREEGAVEKWSEGVMLINPLVTGLSFPGKFSFGAINSDDASSVLRHSRLPPLVFPPLSARHSRIYSVPCCAREADPKSSLHLFSWKPIARGYFLWRWRTEISPGFHLIREALFRSRHFTSRTD